MNLSPNYIGEFMGIESIPNDVKQSAIISWFDLTNHSMNFALNSIFISTLVDNLSNDIKANLNDDQKQAIAQDIGNEITTRLSDNLRLISA